MTYFIDRADAGRQLAKELAQFRDLPDTIVLALPRGGVIVGQEVADFLHLPLDIICPRKIGAPFNPELAIGAVTETGEGIFSEELIEELEVSKTYIDKAMKEEKEKAKWRLDTYRAGRPARDLLNKKVIIVDDGLATGSTMFAAIKTAKAEKAGEIIVAIPVAPPETLKKIKREAPNVICLHSTPHFYAVGQFYENFQQTSDQEVIDILKAKKSLRT